MAERFDVVIVGARCAGSPLATMLAERGLKVCVLDKTEPTTDTPSTHAIQPNGVRVLAQLGLADDLAARTEPIRRGRFAFEDTRVTTGDLLDTFDGFPMLSLRRPVLDPVLARRAEKAGATVRTGTPVTGLLRDGDGRVAGVATQDGEIRAGLVVGADGVRSTVARLAGATEYLRTEIGRSFVWGYFEGTGAAEGTIWLGKIGDTGLLSTPTDGGLSMAAVAVSQHRWREASRDLDATFDEGLRVWPDLADAFAGARRVGGHHVVAHGHGYFRQSAGPGWVLVGDAGHFKDPTPGQGIADALRQADRLAPAIEEALGGAGDVPLTSWWRWRDREAMQMYWLARQMGEAGPLPPILQDMMAALTSSDRGVRRLARVLNHDLEPSRVFGTALLARGVARGLRVRRGARGRLVADAARLAAQSVREQWLGSSARSKVGAYAADT